MLEIGSKIQDFTIPTDRGHFSLSDYRGKNIVLFFFPRADTSGCTKEAVAFTSLLAEFDAANTVVIGISKDTPEKQAKFRAKHNLECLLGADNETDICTIIEKCSIDEISKYLTKERNKRGYPDISIKK